MPGGYSAAVPPVPIPNTEVKHSRVHGSATYVCARVDHCRALYFADMAQLVERTLGKGEVLSSILSISTIFGNLRLGGFFLFFILKVSNSKR